MMNVDEILARLQNGETMDDIAADISKALTAAGQKFQEEKEKKIAEAAALEKEATLNDLAETILLAIDEYVSVKCPEAMDNEGMDMSVAEFREILDGLLDTMVKMKNLFGDFAMEFAPIPVKAPKTEYKAPKKVKTADDKIADFLKTMGW
jgi:hypothetical protein